MINTTNLKIYISFPNLLIQAFKQDNISLKESELLLINQDNIICEVDESLKTYYRKSSLYRIDQREKLIIKIGSEDYRKYSNLIVNNLKKYFNQLEIENYYSFYFDFQNLNTQFKRILDIKLFFEEIFTDLNYKFKIGISDHKFLARLASELDYPILWLTDLAKISTDNFKLLKNYPQLSLDELCKNNKLYHDVIYLDNQVYNSLLINYQFKKYLASDLTKLPQICNLLMGKYCVISFNLKTSDNIVFSYYSNQDLVNKVKRFLLVNQIKKTDIVDFSISISNRKSELSNRLISLNEDKLLNEWNKLLGENIIKNLKDIK